MNPLKPERQCKRCMHRLLVGAMAMALIGLTAGCHKKQKVSRRQAPSAYPASSGSTTAHARPPVSIPNEGPAGAEPVPSGKVVSSETGLASWYGPPYHNRRGANGEIYDQNAMTAAHKTLPMGSVVRVTNLATNQSATVKITDRGPFIRGRVIDLSLAAAKATGIYRAGVAKVRLEVFESARVDTGGKWCVQIGAFESEKNAVKLKSDLLRRYATARVIEFPGPTGHWVRIDPKWNTQANAQEIAKAIHTAEPAAEAYLVRLD